MAVSFPSHRVVSHSLGDTEFLVLTDGTGTFDHSLFPETKPAAIENLLAASGESTLRTNFNAFLIRWPGCTVLVDAGPRERFGPDSGHLPEALREAGTAPEEVDLVFLTHLHPDHAAGTVDAGGRALFPQAEMVVPELEVRTWSDPAPFAGNETLARSQQLAASVLAAYRDRLRTTAGEAEIAPGLTQMPLPGHTPGHSGFRLEADGGTVVHAGDIVHAPFLQLADPEIAIAFDMDRAEARVARRRMLDLLAHEGCLCTGGHFLQPALGRVEASGRGYRFQPEA